MKLFGPFRQLLTLENLPLHGPLTDEQLVVLENAGLLTDEGKVLKTGNFSDLKTEFPQAELVESIGHQVVVPAYVDSHTHLCYGGNRANDFAMRNAGKSYLEIAEAGGGIWSSVQHTRAASAEELITSLLERIQAHIRQGITTIEIKSGYGLNDETELKMLRAIQSAARQTPATVVPTLLAAHMKPKDFSGSAADYLSYLTEKLLPLIKAENLANRVDIFVEKSAFSIEEARPFLEKAAKMGFELTVHADQFTPGSPRLAVEMGACSADHLEATAPHDIDFLAKSETVATALPGASLGLGEPFAPARRLLDAGAVLAIASDFNPGSAPMGNLICQASILAAYEKLTTAEVLSGLTFRAARALNLNDRGRLVAGQKADFLIYDTDNFQNILYRQGMLSPSKIYINAEQYS